jgi:hypothetical protein
MTRLGLAPVIDPTASVQRRRLGRYTQVGARTRAHRDGTRRLQLHRQRFGGDLQPDPLRQFSELCWHWHSLAERRLKEQPKPGVLSDLKGKLREE